MERENKAILPSRPRESLAGAKPVRTPAIPAEFLAELLPLLEGELAAAVLARRDSQVLDVRKCRLIPLSPAPARRSKLPADPAEIRRVLI
jgi:hypothetical protein